MSVERWRMTSGRVATIDLSGHPDALDGARELLRMNGATRTDYAEPVQAFAGDEYDEPRAQRAELTAAQLDGVACVVCGDTSKAMVPASRGPRGQLFSCASHIQDEDALGAGDNQPEGGTKKPAEDSVSSKATRRARAAAARRGTIAADHRIVIEDTPDSDAEQSRITGTAKRRHARLADAELATLPVIVKRTTGTCRAHVWRTADGRWWRRGGTVRIQKWPTRDGARAFVINVWRGANSDDVKFLERIVEGARRGEDFDFFWHRVTADWADEHTYQSGTSRAYKDPYTYGDYAGRVTICDEPLCRSRWHSGVALHELDTAEGPGYSISVCRVDEESLWHVDVNADGAEFTPRELTNFVNDLQWMREECERANGRGSGLTPNHGQDSAGDDDLRNIDR